MEFQWERSPPEEGIQGTFAGVGVGFPEACKDLMSDSGFLRNRRKKFNATSGFAG